MRGRKAEHVGTVRVCIMSVVEDVVSRCWSWDTWLRCLDDSLVCVLGARHCVMIIDIMEVG